MNSPLGTKDRPWRARLSLINGETSSTITAGKPVCFKSTDPSKVVLPSTATASTAHTLFAGVAVSSASPGDPVEIIGSGYVANASVVTQTRAASTDSYASAASVAAGAIYTIDTAKNAFVFLAASASTINNPAYGILVSNLGTFGSIASSPSDTSLFRTTAAKLWVRGLV
ncbi:MAG: hypothetical protein ACUVQP_00065 [Bacteroidales bacterium]